MIKTAPAISQLMPDLRAQIASNPLSLVEKYFDRLKQTPSESTPAIQRAFQSIDFNQTKLISIADHRTELGLAFFRQFPNTWEVSLFHFLDQSSAERGLPILLKKLDTLYYQSKASRAFIPSFFRIRFPLALFAPRLSAFIFAQNGFQATYRLEMKLTAQNCIKQFQPLQVSFGNQKLASDELKFVPFTPVLKNEFVKIGHACITDTIERTLYYNDYLSSFDQFGNHVQDLVQSHALPLIPQLSFLVYQNNRPVGSCLCIEKDDSIYLTDLGVLPAYRKQGVAKKILFKLSSLAEHFGYESITLTSLSTNQKAYGLYKKMGFKEINQQLWYTKHFERSTNA